MQPKIPTNKSEPQKPLRILYHSDSPVAKTGFGKVSYNILKSLYENGEELNLDLIKVIGVNHNLPYYDQSEFPYQIYPASYGGGDALGLAMAKSMLLQGGFDVYFAVNDPDVHLRLADAIEEGRKKHGFKVVLYMPIDLDFPTDAHKEVIKLADYPVLYTEKAKEQEYKHWGKPITKARVINHGTDVETFKQIARKIIKTNRKKVFKADEDDFLVINVNRNQWRKNFFTSILGFLLFHKEFPRSRMYFHSRIVDKGGNLFQQIASACLVLGLAPEDIIQKVILVPPSDSIGMSESSLNAMYNCADCFLSTTLGEGWGLTTTEAMAVGLPVILSDNTTARYLLGDNEERGYLVGIGNNDPIDMWTVPYGNSDAPRQNVSAKEVARQLKEVYVNRDQAKKKGELARKWCEERTWAKVNEQWVELFKEVAGSARIKNKIILQ